MKPIAVKDQVRLSAGRCLYLTLAGMYYRLTRSTITIAIVALAVAFLAYMLAFSVFVQERTYGAYVELHQARLLGEWVARLSAADATLDIVAAVSAGDTARLGEYRRWSAPQMPDSLFAAAVKSFVPYQAFLDYFAAMRPASRAVLLGDADPYELPRLLRNAEYRQVFLRQAGELAMRPPLGDENALALFLERDWPLVDTLLRAVRAGQERVIGQVRQEADGRSLVAWMAQDAAGAVEAAVRTGFSPLDERRAQMLRVQAVQSGHEALLGRVVADQSGRVAVARLLGVNQKNVDLDVLTRWLTGPHRAGAFLRSIAPVYPAADLPTAAELAAVARGCRRTARLQECIGAGQTPGRRGLAGIPQATRWLVIVSFLVCAVGICNTMFMSVTERFTEIATMKCLGAMDGFVMLMFVFEATIQGVAGSLAGIVVGFLLAAARGLAGYGTMFFETVPCGSLGAVAGGAILVGIALAAVSAVGPAWMAARLAPVEAMRVE